MRNSAVMFLLRLGFIAVAFTCLLFGVALVDGTVMVVPGLAIFALTAWGSYKLFQVSLAEPKTQHKNPAAQKRQAKRQPVASYSNKANAA